MMFIITACRSEELVPLPQEAIALSSQKTPSVERMRIHFLVLLVL